MIHHGKLRLEYIVRQANIKFVLKYWNQYSEIYITQFGSHDTGFLWWICGRTRQVIAKGVLWTSWFLVLRSHASSYLVKYFILTLIMCSRHRETSCVVIINKLHVDIDLIYWLGCTKLSYVSTLSECANPQLSTEVIVLDVLWIYHGFLAAMLQWLAQR